MGTTYQQSQQSSSPSRYINIPIAVLKTISMLILSVLKSQPGVSTMSRDQDDTAIEGHDGLFHTEIYGKSNAQHLQEMRKSTRKLTWRNLRIEMWMIGRNNGNG